MATLPGITVQQGIKDTAGGQAIGICDNGGYDQLLIDQVSRQVIGLRQLSTGIGPITISPILAPGHIPQTRQAARRPTRAERDQLITEAKNKHRPAYPPKDTLIQEIIYAQTSEVPAPGAR